MKEVTEKELKELRGEPIKLQVRRGGRIPLKDLWQIDWNECEVVKATTDYVMVVERTRQTLREKEDKIADLESRNRALGKEIAKTLVDHFAQISKQITCLIDRYGE